MAALPASTVVAVVGAGTMGAGIAHVAAAAGHRVLLYDTGAEVVDAALIELRERLDRSVAKGRIDRSAADRVVGGIVAAGSLDDLGPAGLVIEAIVEDLGVKQGMLSDLATIVATDAILATNTSSLSVTAIASALDRPDRVVGMHFFNPAPVMPLVEIVTGAATDPAVAAAAYATAAGWGKTPVHCASTPGFIVNRVARPFYSENLRLFQEGAADMATIDAVLTGSGGFRMGPFTLMDLVGLDVNLAVSTSVYEQTYHDPRFAPNVLQKAKVDAGQLGRKTGTGWYTPAGEPAPPAALPRGTAASMIVAGTDMGYDEGLLSRLTAAGIEIERRRGLGHLIVDDLPVFFTDGRSAAEIAADRAEPHVATLDLALDWAAADRVAIAASTATPATALATVAGTMQAAEFEVSQVRDVPGMITMRTVAQVVSVAADAAMMGVAAPKDIDTAMRLGTNYPGGPFEWADRIGVSRIVGVLDALHRFYGEDRYRCAAWLRAADYEGIQLRALAAGGP